MENEKAKRISELYLKKVKHWSYLSLVLTVAALFLPVNIIVRIILAIVVCFVSMCVTTFQLRKKYIAPIINEELDPQTYIGVICNTRLNTKYALDEILSAFLMGDYRTVINICTLKLADEKCKANKINYLVYLARVYFDLCDYEKLREVCTLFDRAVENRKNEDGLRNVYVIFRFYKLYLEGDFDACRDLYADLAADPKKCATKYAKVQINYSYAIALYKSGDLKKAEEIFSYIVSEAPLLNYAYYSRKYLAAISGDEELDEKAVIIEADEGFSVPKPERAKPAPMSKGRKILLAVCVIVLILCTPALIKLTTGKYAATPFDAIAENSSIAEIVETVDIGDGEDMFIIYREKDESLAVAYVEKKSEKRFKFIISCETVDTKHKNVLKIANDDVKISYSVCDSLESIPENVFKTVELEDQGKTVYFCIESIEEEYNLFNWSSSHYSD